MRRLIYEDFVAIFVLRIGLKRASVLTSGTPDIGKSFETVVFHLLRQQYRDIFFWRAKGEIDFVVLNGTSPQAIQVSWDGTKDRLRRAVDEFMKKFPDALEPRFITQDNFKSLGESLLKFS